MSNKKILTGPEVLIAAQLLATYERSRGFVWVPLRLWVPDAVAVAYAWTGRLHNAVLGRASRKLLEGILPGRFRGRFTQGRSGCAPHARHWARELPVIHPEQLLELVQASFPSHWIALRTEFPDKGRFDLVLAIAEATTRDAFALAERRFDLTQSQVEHHWLQVTQTAQGQGIGTQVVAALLPFYEILGIYRITITAGLSIGGALWGKFGFAPEPEEWLKVQRIILANIRRAQSQQGLSTTVQEAMADAAAWAHGENPKNLWRIMSIGRQHQLSGVRLDKVLLRDLRWKGSLTFSDRIAVKRMRDCFTADGVDCRALDSLEAAALNS